VAGPENERDDAMRGKDYIHPALATRKRRFALPVATFTFVAGAIGLGWTTMSGLPRLSPVQFADAQVKEDSAPGDNRSGRLRASDPLASPVIDGVSLHNSVSRQAGEWGIRTCLDHVATLSDFLTVNRSYTALSQRGQSEPDGEAFSSTIAARDATGIDSLSTFISAPVGSGKCNSAYQTVAAFPGNCRAVREEHFPSFNEVIAFGDKVEAWKNQHDGYVFLLPVDGLACTAIKTQIVHQVPRS